MNELKRDLFLGGVTLVVIVLIGAASLVAFHQDEERHRRLTAEVPATIIEVYERRGTNPQTGKTGGVVNVLVSYHYEIEGKKYARKIIIGEQSGKSFKVGAPAKVCYNPRAPEEAELFSSEYPCGR